MLLPDFQDQQSKIDSLTLAISKAESDLDKINTLYEIAIIYYNSGSEKTLDYTSEMKRLARSGDILKNKDLMAKSLCNAFYLEGGYLAKVGRYLEALEKFDELILIAEENNLFNYQAMAYVVQGSIYNNKGQLVESMDARLKAVEFYKKADDKAGEAYALNGIASYYIRKIKSENAKTYQDTALILLNQVVTLSQDNNNKDLEANANSLIGSVYHLSGELELALGKYRESLKIYEDIGNNLAIADMKGIIGNVYFLKRNYDSAFYYFNQSIEISTRNSYREMLVKISISKAEVLLQLGDTTESLEILRKIKSEAAANGMLNHLKTILTLQQKIYQSEKYFEKALITNIELQEVSDSIKTDSDREKIASLEFEYQIKNAKQELVHLHDENRYQAKIKWIIITAASLITGLGIIIILMLVRRNGRNKEMYNTQNELHQLEISNSKLKENNLIMELELKNKELTTQALNLVQKENMMRELKDSIKKLRKTVENPNEINLILRQIDLNKNKEKDWDEFKLYFEQVHTDFFKELSSRIGDLSPSEIKLAALLRLNLSTKQCADILGISVESAKMARYRLRKKLQLPSEENLTSYLMTLS